MHVDYYKVLDDVSAPLWSSPEFQGLRLRNNRTGSDRDHYIRQLHLNVEALAHKELFPVLRILLI